MYWAVIHGENQRLLYSSNSLTVWKLSYYFLYLDILGNLYLSLKTLSFKECDKINSRQIEHILINSNMAEKIDLKKRIHQKL